MHRVVSLFNQHRAVDFAEPILLRRADRTPGDPEFSTQWWHQALGSAAAWDTTTGSADVIVAVIDSGIISSHPDLQNRLNPGYDMISDVENAGDGDGRDANPEDERHRGCHDSSGGFHGTSVSGIIAGAAENGEFGTGLDWNARIQPLRVLGCDGTGTTLDIADAIRWAAGIEVNGHLNPQPAHIINLSLGGLGQSRIEHEALSEALATGAIIVASAGNRAGLAAGYAPGGLPNVITVGALNMNGRLSVYSNQGSAVDIAAYGGVYTEDFDADQLPDTVLTTDVDKESLEPVMEYFNGTSAAAPMVAGALALIRSVAPGIDLPTARWVLQQTADSANIECPAGCGAGALRVDYAVELAQQVAANPAIAPLLLASEERISAFNNHGEYGFVLANNAAHSQGLLDISVEGEGQDAVQLAESLELEPGTAEYIAFTVSEVPGLSGLKEAEIVITSPDAELRVVVVTHHGAWQVEDLPYIYVVGLDPSYEQIVTTATGPELGYRYLLRFFTWRKKLRVAAFGSLAREREDIFVEPADEWLYLAYPQVREGFDIIVP
jgi:serine protease